MEDNLQDLYKLVDAIENHQPEMTHQLYQSHISRFNETVV